MPDFAQLLAQANEMSAARWAALPVIKREFYALHEDIAAMGPEEVAAVREAKNKISVEDVSGGNRHPPSPITQFHHAFAKFPEIMDEITKQGFTEPSPIQCQLWPILLSGFDAIGIAQTGTGKTLAYLLPALIHIDEQPTPRAQRRGPSCLILTPTRELALQIESEVRKYNYRGIRSVCVYGGGKRREQVAICDAGVEIVIATPGRLTDLVMDRVIDLASITYLVLDEADRMLDMGFEPQIKKILCDVRPDRHSVMTSATWPSLVRELADKYTKNPFLVFVGSLDLTAAKTVTQRIHIVQEEDKRNILYSFLADLAGEDKCLVFVGRKGTADDVCSDLGRRQIRVGALHGDRNQDDRESALDDIRTGKSKLLVATDVASRGLDIPGITHVFNFDFPRDIEDYVHRVGRTGRAGKTGTAITLMTRSNWNHAPALYDILLEANQEIPPKLVDMKAFYERKASQPGFVPRPSRYARPAETPKPAYTTNPDSRSAFLKPSEYGSLASTSGAELPWDDPCQRPPYDPRKYGGSGFGGRKTEKEAAFAGFVNPNRPRPNTGNVTQGMNGMKLGQRY